MIMAQAKYKPLLFTTTIRNPERFKDFMYILFKYNGQVLTEKIIEAVEKDIFTVGLYRPTKRIPASVKQKWSTTSTGEFAEEALTSNEAKTVYDNNDPQKWDDIKGHKEAGFAQGWRSRFDTQYKLMKTLGFVKYKMNEPICFSEVGEYLAKSIEITVTDDGMIERHSSDTPQYEQMAFMQAFAKYQRCNPFVRELNDNIPLILLLQVIQKLNADSRYNNCGISYKELPLVIFWRDNDAETLYQRIVKLRAKYGYTPSDEVVAKICTKEILGEFKKFKLKSIVSEYPDEFVRKMRMTGLVSFRGAGRFIDINHVEDKKVFYILKTYSNYCKYTDEDSFFDYMSKIDPILFSKESKPISKTAAGEKLNYWITVYGWEKIKGELYNLEKKNASKDAVLKFMAAPARLEFLTALAIKTTLPNVSVIPNYSCDDEGLPTSTAGGNKADIECYENQNGVIVEVTMAEGRQQTMMEIWPIARHLQEFSHANNINSQCVFIAPTIYTDSKKQIDYAKKCEGVVIRPYSIHEFVNYLAKSTMLFFNTVTSLSDYPDILNFVVGYLEMVGVSTIHKLSMECILKFGELYPEWNIRDWYNILLPYVQKQTKCYKLSYHQEFNYHMVADGRHPN